MSRLGSIRVVAFFVLVLIPIIAPHPVGAQESRGARGPQGALPKELKGLEIRDTFVPLSLPEVGVIHGLEGEVVVVHTGTGEAYFGMEGDPLYEKDSLTTFLGSRCRIRFLDEDVVTMASETNFSVETHEDRKEEGSTRSVFSLLKGKAMFYALRLFRYKENRVTLNTPTAVVGVRGTKFGAEVTWVDEKKLSATGLRVADLGGGMGVYLGQLGSDTARGKSFTNCFSEDGVLDVNGTIVSPGEMYRGDIGRVLPTPPQYVKAFEAQTEVRRQEKEPTKGMGPEGKGEPKAEKKEKTDDRGPKPPSSLPPHGMLGMPPGAGLFPPPGEKLVDIKSQQGGKKIEQEQVFLGIEQGKVAGGGSFIAAMMLKGDKDGQAFNNDGRDPMYFSDKPNLLNAPDQLERHVAFENAHPGESGFKMEVQEINDSMNMEVKYFTLNHMSNKALVPPNIHVFQYQGIGFFEDPKGHRYLEWGYWGDTASSSIGLVGKDLPAGAPNDLFNVAKGMIWHVEGDLTHPDYIDYLKGQNAVFNYTGNAVGVFANSAASQVHILGGDFSCQVHFGNNQVSNFNIDTSEAGNYRVNMVGGSGSVNSDGTFRISSFSAGSSINGNPIVNETGARGATFGPKAEGVAGTWNAHDGANYWATGEFHGKR